ncbi:MAG: IS5 family transposase [Salinisphaera sp.]|uniref:IS5 family transposase n=1 Tax=Salinisphaera sp. TaxID=1914330 RepID=UPI003C7BF93B
MAQTGRPKKMGPEHYPVLREIVTAKPLSSMTEIGAAFTRRTGLRVHRNTLADALAKAGITRTHHPRTPAEKQAEVEPDSSGRYGYGPAHRASDTAGRYASSLTDAEWALVADIFEVTGRGKPPAYPRRLLVDACCYVVRTGCAWRMLPADFPTWQNVYRTFRRWMAQGKFEAMHDRLRAQWRARLGRNNAPTASAIDAQSNRGSPQGGATGYDAGKKVKGRKRHVVVDTLGLLLAVSVTAASVQDRAEAHPVMAEAIHKYPSLQTVFADNGYAGRCAQTLTQTHDIDVDIVRHPRNATVGRWSLSDQPDLFTQARTRKPFVVLPKRWVVERTHAWIERARRLVMHHDRRTDVAGTWVWLAQARMLAARLTRRVM